MMGFYIPSEFSTTGTQNTNRYIKDQQENKIINTTSKHVYLMMNKKNCLKLRYDKLKIFHLRSTIKLHKKFLQKKKKISHLRGGYYTTKENYSC